MGRLDRYILRLILWPFLFFMLVFTGVIWLSQSLRVIEPIVNSGQSAGTFLGFVPLLLPRVFDAVLPISAFAATLYAINRLYTDSEVVVMFASGMSGLRLLRPVMAFAFAVALIAWGISLWAAPMAQREFRDRLAEVRGDVAAAFLREGTFMSPADEVTIYIREMGRPGEMLGIFVHDERDPERVVTYTAERAVLLRDGKGTRLVMFDGVAQLTEGPQVPRLQVLRFDQFAYDLTAFEGEVNTRRRKPGEMFLPQLLEITEEEAAAQNRSLGEFRAEAHEALSAPLYVLVLPALAVAFVVTMGFRRQGFTGRIIGAVAAATFLRMAGLAVKGAAVSQPTLVFLLYLPPLAGLALALWMLSQAGRGGVLRPRAAAGAAS